MNSTDEYNGWANRETWALNLLLSNDEALDEMTWELVQGVIGALNENAGPFPGLLTDARLAYPVGSAIVEWVLDGCGMDDDLAYETVPRWYVDLRNDVGSLWRVDVAELGSHWLPDAECVDA